MILQTLNTTLGNELSPQTSLIQETSSIIASKLEPTKNFEISAYLIATLSFLACLTFLIATICFLKRKRHREQLRVDRADSEPMSSNIASTRCHNRSDEENTELLQIENTHCQDKKRASIDSTSLTINHNQNDEEIKKCTSTQDLPKNDDKTPRTELIAANTVTIPVSLANRTSNGLIT